MKIIIIITIVLLISYKLFAQFIEQISGTEYNLHSVSAVDNNVAWVCGTYGRVLYTTNGGTSWNMTTIPNSELDMGSICAIDDSKALVSGLSYNSRQTYVYKTTNKGINWMQTFYQNNGCINAIEKIGDSASNNFIIFGDPVGHRWSIWKSTNSGLNWDSSGQYISQIDTTYGFYNAMCTYRTNMNDYIWFGALNGNIYKSINATNWIVYHVNNNPCFSIYFIDSLFGYIGSGNVFFRTTDGGLNWVQSTGMCTYVGITGFGDEVWACCNNNIYYSTNKGINFSKVYTSDRGIYQFCAKARAINNNNMWFVKTSGGITKYNYVIGVKQISNIVPNNFFIYPNYPNPFNPKTIINYQLPKNSYVNITVFNSLGEKIAVLVNEKQNAGEYRVEWDGTNFPGGIYFFQIKAGDFTKTNKMILLK